MDEDGMILKSGKSNAVVTAAQTKVRRSRIAMMCSLVTAVVAFGYGSYRLGTDLETILGESQYRSIEDNFESSLLSAVGDKASSVQALSHHIGFACPYKEIWPNCSLPLDSFEFVSSKMLLATSFKALSFSPLVSEPDVPQFEQFAYDFFAAEGEPDLAQLSFGEGIFARDSAGDVIHDYDASNAKGTRDILVPVFEIGLLADNRGAVMFNIYSEIEWAQAIDHAIGCAGNADACVSVTSVTQIVQVEKIAAASLMMVPLTPYYDKDTVVGVTVAVFFWDSTFVDAIPTSANGIFVVLINTVNGEKHSYEFRYGSIAYLGPGDLSPGDLPDSYKYFLIPQLGNIQYKIKLTSSDKFMSDYRTWAPVISCCVAICIILLTSAVFVFYDSSVKVQNKFNNLLIQSKRTFVTYFSHEIRTPLDTIHLSVKVLSEGLAILQGEVKDIGDTLSPSISKKIEELIDFTLDVEESNDAAVATLNDLINYDKIMLGAMVLNLGKHSVWKIVADAVRPFYVQAHKKEIKIEMDLEPLRKGASASDAEKMYSLVVLADMLRLKQVLRNLVSNALKFTRVGDGVITITGMLFWCLISCVVLY
jgi:hypothetical protein